MPHTMVASASSLLIALVKNALLAARAVVATLLDGDHCRSLDEDSGAHHPLQHCPQCAAKYDEEGRLLSGPDVAAVMACLGMTLTTTAAGAATVCGGCEAMGVVEEVAWGAKEAGEEELKEAFAVFDRDGDGFVSPAELWGVLRRLRMPEGARYEDCVRMLDAAAGCHGDAGGGSGRVGFREFKAMMDNAV